MSNEEGAWAEDPGVEDPGAEDLGAEDPGVEDPGAEDLGAEDPGTEGYTKNSYSYNEEEVIVMPTAPSVEFSFTPGPDICSELCTVENTYNAIMEPNEAIVNWKTVNLTLPASFLPLSLRAVFGYTVSPTLLDIEFEWADSWRQWPQRIDIEHPVYKDAYVGKHLVWDVVHKFFCKDYKPKGQYRSASYLLRASGTPDRAMVHRLMRDGFDSAVAERALVASKNDFEKALQFLKTGEPLECHVELIEYMTCPLLYLVLELADVFLDLSDHCCICRAPLTPGIKLSVCTNKLCNFQMAEIGVGVTVCQEIKRDPDVADLVFSMFTATYGSPFMTPAPPFEYSQDVFEDIFLHLPPMRKIADECNNDQEVASKIGKEALCILRWVLFSNRSHLISLPPSMRLQKFTTPHQFITLMASPEREHAFTELKKKYGSIWLFHGSCGDRWHSILRNGLKNASGTKLQANGAALGSGIYFARQSETSWGYSRPVPNKYAASTFGKSLHIIALCEVANIPAGDIVENIPSLSGNKSNITEVAGHLKDHGWAHTLTLEEACIVRLLFVGGDFHVDTIANPPTNVPTLKEVLRLQAEGCYPGSR